LQRVFGVAGTISDFTWQALRAMTPPDKEPLASLSELAKACRSLGLGIYLDIKELNFATLDTIFSALDEHDMMGATIFSSFRADWLAEIKAQRPTAVTSILFSSIHVDPAAQAQAIQSDYVHPCWERFDAPHTLLTPEWLASVRALGVGIACWHEERPAEIQALQALGVNAICSDLPELLLPQRA
jgi:glycerophosphoryl diester phosphodiesterase